MSAMGPHFTNHASTF